jgi:hypothetical protein
MAGESLDMLARVYHTENGNVHAEGDEYAVTDPVIAETLYGCGFASPVGWTPEPPLDTRGADSGPDARHDDPRHADSRRRGR